MLNVWKAKNSRLIGKVDILIMATLKDNQSRHPEDILPALSAGGVNLLVIKHNYIFLLSVVTTKDYFPRGFVCPLK